MAGNNLLHFLRGGLGNATDESTLEPGQPFYNYSKNYLTVGGKNKDTKVNGKPLTVREVVGYTADNDNSITSGTAGEFHLKYSNRALELLTPDNFTFKSGESEIATYSSDNSGTITLHKPITSSYSATYGSLIINGDTNCQTCLPSNSNTYNLGSPEKKFKTLYANNANIGTLLSDNVYSGKFTNSNKYDVVITPTNDNSDAPLLPLIKLSATSPTIKMGGIIQEEDGNELNIGTSADLINAVYAKTIYAKTIGSPTIDKINERLDELGFKTGNLINANNETIVVGRIARLGMILYGTINPGIGVTGGLSIKATDGFIPADWVSVSFLGKLPLKLNGSRGGELTLYMTIEGEGDAWRINIPAVSNPTEIYTTSDYTWWVDCRSGFSPLS